MLEKHISKRVIFPKRAQQRFLVIAIEKFGGAKFLAEEMGLSTRTVRDWRREKFSMDYSVLRRICLMKKLTIPKGLKIRDRYWYVLRGGKAGGVAVYKKYGYVGGDPENRKRKWYAWWERKGKFISNSICKRKAIRKPRKNVELAEFVGIIMGDGSISERQVAITLHHLKEREYGRFVSQLAKRLFGVTPSLYHDPADSVIDIVISRTELVAFLSEKLGLKVGNKVRQQFDIPRWIKQSRQFRIACVRGLVDTDGSVFIHRYEVNGRWYAYKKLSFTSFSWPLIISVHKILEEVGINARISQGKEVRIDSVSGMEKYFQVFGFHNPWHLKRYLN